MPAVRSEKSISVYRKKTVPVPRMRRRLTASQKEMATLHREMRNAIKELEATKEWLDSLEPWDAVASFRFPIGTRLIFKPEAKSRYGLTENEIQTLPHKYVPGIDPGSPKCFYAQEDVAALRKRKVYAYLAHAGPAKAVRIIGRGPSALEEFCVEETEGRSRRSVVAQFVGYIDPREYRSQHTNAWRMQCY